MTDIQVESGLTKKPRKQQQAKKQGAAIAMTDDGQIPFNDAAREGKELVHRLDSEWRQFRLGELPRNRPSMLGALWLSIYEEPRDVPHDSHLV